MDKVYLGSDFLPERVANDVVKATTTTQESVLDLDPAIKRLIYDKDEFESRLAAVSREHTSELLEAAHAIEEAKTLVEGLDPLFSNVSSARDKLERDFSSHYRRLRQLHTKATNLHLTAKLGRTLLWYLQIARQLPTADDELTGLQLLRAAQNTVVLNKLVSFDTSLAQVRIVSSHSKTLSVLQEKIVDIASKDVSSFTGDTVKLKFALLSLQALNSDIAPFVESLLSQNVNTSVLQLSKAAGQSTPGVFVQAVDDTRTRIASLQGFDRVMDETKIQSPKSTLVNVFEDQVAINLAQKLKTMSLANAQAARIMQSQEDRLLDACSGLHFIHNVFERHLRKSSSRGNTPA